MLFNYKRINQIISYGISNTQPYSILASQRTGSNLLQTLLNSHSRIICLGEILVQGIHSMDTDPNIKSWADFKREIRPKGCGLLKRLDDFPESILVTGCQRSGTTVLSMVISGSAGIVQYTKEGEPEFRGALILAGITPHEPRGRYCFQTTYLDECYREYYEKTNGHKLIWVLRNPYSTVYSMLQNWSKASFNSLFIGCGSGLLTGREKSLYKYFGQHAIGRIKRACLSYNSKLAQLFELKENLPEGSIGVVEYDELVKSKHAVLPLIYDYIGLKYDPGYAEVIYSISLSKKDRLSKREARIIQDVCMPLYRQAADLVDFLPKTTV